MGCPKDSVTNYQRTPCNIAEEGGSQLRCSGSLKSHELRCSGSLKSHVC